MTEELAIYFTNLRRQLTEKEEENIANYFNANDSDDDGGKEPTFTSLITNPVNDCSHLPVTSLTSEMIMLSPLEIRVSKNIPTRRLL